MQFFLYNYYKCSADLDSEITLQFGQ